MGALKEVKMITYDVTTSVDLDRQGKYQQRREKTQLVVRIDRSRAAQLNENESPSLKGTDVKLLR